MQFATYARDGAPRAALVQNDDAIDLGAALGERFSDMLTVIESGMAPGAIAAACADAPRMQLASIRLLAPIARPGKTICLGLNYLDHAKEGGFDVPEFPTLFLRASSSLIGPNDAVLRPRISTDLDYEAELLCVIGRTARHVAEAQALDHVFGYAIFNDVTVRDYQRRTTQWTAGKIFDGTGAMGPAITPAEAVPAGASGLRIRALLNDTVMQDDNTANMIFPVARTIALLSQIMTLSPGDVIAMGTPQGVGYARTPPVWLKPGDKICIEIEGLGRLENVVTAEL